MSRAAYNEIDPKAAAWLRELIKKGLIAPGDVIEASIEDLTPNDLKPYTQVHFFAGIGVWSYALRGAGWPDDRPVWTGSAPCQPFSAAGKGNSSDDERHLWPAFYKLIRACQPPVIFGEQVASSLAVGKSTANVQPLWERQAYLRLLSHGLEGHISKHLQAMQERDREGTSRLALHEYRHAGEPLGGWGEVPSSAEELALRHIGGVGAGAPDGGNLRSDGHPFQHGGETGLEHAIARPESAGRGLHDVEHSTDPVRLERSVWELGRAADGRDGERHLEETARDFAAAINSNCRSIEEADGWSWIDTLQADLEDAGYASGAVDLCAAGVGAPHIRQRLWWFGERLDDAPGARHVGQIIGTEGHSRDEARLRLSGAGRTADRLDDDDDAGLEGQRGRHQAESGRVAAAGPAAEAGELDGLEYRSSDGREQRRPEPSGRGIAAGRSDGGLANDQRQQRPGSSTGGDVSGGRDEEPAEAAGLRRNSRPGPTNGLWGDADWLHCRDGKWRPVEPGTFPLVNGAAERVGRLRGYGNAIVAPAAQAFIEAYLETEADGGLSVTSASGLSHEVGVFA